MVSPSGRLWRAGLPTVAALAVVMLLVAPVTPSRADPVRVDETREQLDTVTEEARAASDRLGQLVRDAEVAVEDYNEARARHENTRQRLRIAIEELEELQASVASTQASADAFARELYQGGSVYGVQALLEASDLAEMRTRVVYLRSATAARSDVVDRLRTERTSYLDDLARIEGLRAEAAASEQALERRRSRVQALLASQRAEVARLEAEVGAARTAHEDAVDAERERQARERARRERERREREQRERERREQQRREQQRREQQRQAELARARTADGAGTDGGAVAGSPVPEVAADAGGAVEAALSQLGKPYVWAAEGPDAYDCSGLTLWAWEHAGVSLPHSSRLQYATLPHVPLDDIQPGDLVFFGAPIHHVAMYVGDGTVIEAPYSGSHVRLNDSALRRGDLVGVARPGGFAP